MNYTPPKKEQNRLKNYIYASLCTNFGFLVIQMITITKKRFEYSIYWFFY